MGWICRMANQDMPVVRAEQTSELTPAVLEFCRSANFQKLGIALKAVRASAHRFVCKPDKGKWAGRESMASHRACQNKKMNIK